MPVQLNILCLICINRQYPKNYIEFDNDTRVLLNFHSRYSKTRTICDVSPDEIQHDHPLPASNARGNGGMAEHVSHIAQNAWVSESNSIEKLCECSVCSKRSEVLNISIVVHHNWIQWWRETVHMSHVWLTSVMMHLDILELLSVAGVVNPVKPRQAIDDTNAVRLQQLSRTVTDGNNNYDNFTEYHCQLSYTGWAKNRTVFKIR